MSLGRDEIQHIQAENNKLQQEKEQLKASISDTELKIAQLSSNISRLKAEESLSRLVMGIKDYAIFMLDTEGYIITWNPGAEKLKGYTADEVIGKHFSIFYPETEANQGKPQRELEIAKRDGRFEDEGWRVRKDGSFFWANVVITAIYDHAGKLIGFSKVTKDLTEKKVAEEMLEKKNMELALSNTELEQFAYVASHDLQEPVRGMGIYAQIFAKRYNNKLDEEGRHWIDMISKAAHQLRVLIMAILQYYRVSKAGSGRKPVDLNDIWKKVQAEVQKESPELTLQLNRPLPTVTASKEDMLQLFYQLIDNAIKFRKPEVPPVVEVNVRQQGRQWLFSVKDNGIGIEKEHQGRIFMMFQHLHDRRIYPGSGIGLALCKKIVERHYGEMWVESTPGTGTTFFFTLPVNGK